MVIKVFGMVVPSTKEEEKAQETTAYVYNKQRDVVRRTRLFPRIMEYLSKGGRTQYIPDTFGVAHSTVLRWCKAKGHPNLYSAWSSYLATLHEGPFEDKVERALWYVKEGRSVNKAVKLVGITRPPLLRRAKAAGFATIKEYANSL